MTKLEVKATQPMKFKHINIKNLVQLVPSWSINVLALGREMDFLFGEPAGKELLEESNDVYKKLKFWIEVDASIETPSIRFCTPDENVDLSGTLIIISNPLIGNRAQIEVPLNPVLKGYAMIDDNERAHVVYCHSFQTDVPLAYIGVTKKRWYERLSQHLSSAKSGSPYLFHQAIIRHQDVQVLHKVFICELDYETAMDFEEEFVENMSLYPLGLNMIPGGKAGVKYLHKLGFSAKSASEKEEITEKLALRDNLEGKPNPLCAARWAADAEFVERVICGHSGRLTGEQVRIIRLFASFGKTKEQITTSIGALNKRQVAGVLNEKTYSRIK